MSNNEYIKKDILDADNAIKEAQLSMIATLKRVYPVGSRVKAKLGRALLTVEITGHCHHYWYQPDYLSGFNVDTGSVRHFHFSAIKEGGNDE